MEQNMQQPNKEQEYMSEEVRNLIGDQIMAIVNLRVKLRLSEERIKELEDGNLRENNER